MTARKFVKDCVARLTPLTSVFSLPTNAPNWSEASKHFEKVLRGDFQVKKIGPSLVGELEVFTQNGAFLNRTCEQNAPIAKDTSKAQ